MDNLYYVFNGDVELDIPVSGVWYITLEPISDSPESGSGSGVDHNISIALVIALENNSINFTINYQVSQLIPSPLSLNYGQFNLYRTKWQQVIGPNVLENPNDFTYEFNYPIKYNILIAHLIVRDMLIKSGNDFMMTLFEGSLFSKNEVSPSGIVGSIKGLKTGPIEAEWFDGSNVTKEIFKSGGTFDTINSVCCSLASDLGISLGFCKEIETSIVPIVVKPLPQYVNLSSIMDKI